MNESCWSRCSRQGGVEWMAEGEGEVDEGDGEGKKLNAPADVVGKLLI